MSTDTNSKKLVVTLVRHDTGNIVASDALDTYHIFYTAETDKCTDDNGKEVDCPDIIKQHLRQPIGWIIAVVVLVLIIGALSVLYINK